MLMPHLRYVSSWELEDSWKYAGDGWGIRLHSMCSRTGSFPPALAYYFVEKYSRPGDVVLDPFSGKGTAPLEACRSGRLGVGNDLAPEAYALTRAKVRPAALEEVVAWASRNRGYIEGYRGGDAPDEVRVFYSGYTLRQILAARELLLGDESDLGYFVKSLLLGILHGSGRDSLSVSCSHSFSMSPGYLERSVRERGLRRPRRNLAECLVRRAARIIDGYRPRMRGYAFNLDARSLVLQDESVDLVITSPPYFNMQTYAWDNWLRLWFLGYSYKDVARQLFHTDSVVRVRDFMRETLREIYRVLKDGRACIMVVGVVRRRGEVINMAELIAPLAEEVGFTPYRVIADEVPKPHKYLMYLKGDQGLSKEVILELHKGVVEPRRVRVDWGGDAHAARGVVAA